MNLTSPDVVLAFWFNELEPAQWWRADSSLDQELRGRFGQLHRAAAEAELYSWRITALGRLAEVIVLDQFSRNIYRGTAAAFACDSMALALAQEAVARRLDEQIEPVQRAFLYLPYMHSESKLIHVEALRLFSAPGLEFNLKSELQHMAIIERFGRYPHRNDVLNRVSTCEEQEFLKQPGSSF